MKSIQQYIYYSLILLVASSLVSCKKFVDTSTPPNQIISSTVFSSSATANSAIAGIYVQMTKVVPTVFNGEVSLYLGSSADELTPTFANAEVAAFGTNTYTPTNSYIGEFWINAYNYIYQANACIEGLSQSSAIPDSTQKYLTGEAKFIRALCYFYLINFFGDVPLITGTNFKNNQAMERTASTTVYAQIVADLTDAQSLLPASYGSAAKQRPINIAAAALLARVYLVQGNYTAAEAAASFVINSGKVSLESDLNKVFLLNSSEAIWQLYPVAPFYNTVEGVYFLPTASPVNKPLFAMTSALVNAFETGDQRYVNWVRSKTVLGTVYYYPFKYKVRSNSTVTESNMVIRLAELYLIRAEARAKLNNLSGAETDLNTIRTRAGLPANNSSTQASLIGAIMHERQIEFFAEWGHRWIDLKRSGSIDAVLGTLKGTNWKSTAALYPVPQSELLVNTNLTQNQGY